LLHYYHGLAIGSGPNRPASEPSSDQTAQPTSVVTIAVTLTSKQDVPLTGEEAGLLNDALSEAVGELVEKTMTDVKDDPTLTSATATVQVELSEEPDGPDVG
jgi:hypothetical protein